jgi:hypothetical protein
VVVVRLRNPRIELAPREPSSSMRPAMRGAAEVVGLGVPRGLTCEMLAGDDAPNAVLGRADSVNANVLVMATRAPEAIDRAIHGAWPTAWFVTERGRWCSCIRAPTTWAAATCICVEGSSQSTDPPRRFR